MGEVVQFRQRVRPVSGDSIVADAIATIERLVDERDQMRAMLRHNTTAYAQHGWGIVAAMLGIGISIGALLVLTLRALL